jgi:hypothetical protein
LDLVGHRAELFERDADVAQRGRAEIGTERVAEIDDQPFASEG